MSSAGRKYVQGFVFVGVGIEEQCINSVAAAAGTTVLIATSNEEHQTGAA